MDRFVSGDHLEAGSTTPIHIQLFDEQDRPSEDIRLKHDEHEKHNFQPGGKVLSNEAFSPLILGVLRQRSMSFK